MRSPTQSTVRLIIRCDRASKSNISIRHVAASAETIGTIEVAFDVKRDRLFQGGESAIVTRPLQPIDLALREVLVAAADGLGRVDILDIRSRAERGIGRQHQILEAARLAGTDVEEAADRWRCQQP